MTEPNDHLARSGSSAPLQASFIVRVWRPETADEWRCHLIEVKSGQRIVCRRLDDLATHIALWLLDAEETGRSGLR